MSHTPTTASLDLIRWTFTTNLTRRDAVAEHLNDLGLDVQAYPDGTFVAVWEAPDRDVEPIIEDLWAINGAPFDVTQEEFQRTGLHILHDGSEEATLAA